MYQPSPQIIDNYANVLVNFALNGGRGVKKGEVVFLQVPESAKPLLKALQKAVLKASAHLIIQYLPDELSRDFFELANEDQLNFFPATFLKGRVRQADHFLMILAETNYHELEGIDPKKIMKRSLAFKPYKQWRDEKEGKGKLTWTLALWATPAMAKEANLTLRQTWQQIIRACYLKHSNPVAKWVSIQKKSQNLIKKLNQLDIVSLNIKSKGTDLTIGLGQNRKWAGCDGRNIPSFEIFTSPDWRQVNGHIFFDQPLYRQGNLIKNISLTFKEGVIVDVKADHGLAYLKELIKVENSDKIGEFSLTDKRFSKINKFMAETLYDENYGGDFGNTHIALGSSYQDTCSLDPKKITLKELLDLGFNQSPVHTDIISTSNRTVTATLKNGKTFVLYQSGLFKI